jgi:DNA-binding transcriptional MerR regulator
MEETNGIKKSIQDIYDILNHWTNLPQNGQPPYSPLPEESVQLLKEQLERLKKSLAEKKEVRKEGLKLAGLKEFIIPHEIKILRDEPKWLEPIRLEPIRFEPTRFEPTRFEPKLLKTRPQKKSDGWRTPNRNN